MKTNDLVFIDVDSEESTICPKTFAGHYLINRSLSRSFLVLQCVDCGAIDPCSIPEEMFADLEFDAE